MEQLTDLKAILHSKRANIYYLDKCRVMQKDGRVLYQTENKKAMLYWNIPIANTTVILLGIGTSITQAAMRMLASAGVLVGFSGNGGTPLLMGSESVEDAIHWLTPQSEYRPTEYVQGWMKWWFDDAKRLEVAKIFQQVRIDFLQKIWSKKDKDLFEYDFDAKEEKLAESLEKFKTQITNARDNTALLLQEAELTKRLYKFAIRKTNYDKDFVRQHGKFEDKTVDLANQFLDHGNYLAYGLAATTLWVLGIPHGFAVMHGKTRRGALVFDVADLIKDILILPFAFIAAKNNYREPQFREMVLDKFTQHDAMDLMFNTVKNCAMRA